MAIGMSKHRLIPVPQAVEDELVVIPRRWMNLMEERLGQVHQLLLRPLTTVAAPAPADGWLTRDDVATLTKYSSKTVRRWVRTGKLKAYRPPGSTGVRYKRADVEAMMASTGEGEEDRELAEAQAKMDAAAIRGGYK